MWELGALPTGTADLVTAAGHVGEDIASALELAVRAGNALPAPGSGRTLGRWAVLAAFGRAGLTAARVAEAHLDALAILGEAGVPAPAGSWGVFAAEAPGHVLTARPGPLGATLDGTKPWCSLGNVLDHALVTARVDGGRALFAVDLHHAGVHAAPAGTWAARGLRTVTTVSVGFESVPAEPVGGTDWYLRRAGFAWGGMGVAACWFGGAVGLADTLRAAAAKRADPFTALALGEVDAVLHAAGAVLVAAAGEVDGGRAAGAAGELLALRVRAVVADCAERVLRAVAHALGPAPMAFDPAHAARVADLQLYVRQHHAERDLAALGERLLSAGADGTA